MGGPSDLSTVADQDLDVWKNIPACVPDALRHYYYQYLASTSEAAEEKIAMLQEKESLQKENERLNHEKSRLLKNKDLADGQISALTKALEAHQKDLKDKENLVQNLKQSLELQRKDLNDCRSEITALKMQIEGFQSGRLLTATDADPPQSDSIERYKEEIKSLQMEIEALKLRNANAPDSLVSISSDKEYAQASEKIVEIHEDKTSTAPPVGTAPRVTDGEDAQSLITQISDDSKDKSEELPQGAPVNPSNDTCSLENSGNVSKLNGELPSEDGKLLLKSDNLSVEAASETTASSLLSGPGTIQILAAALPKIVPYVLINHREELLPLIMCAIERHPESSTRDSLTHTLFNLIKRPDEQQRRIIMDACVSLAKNVGEMRTETELLPQCWEQINHMYEERRLLVAQSCGQLAEFVRPEIRDSLILSIIQQLIEDSATVVREAAACNLAMLLPLFPNMDKYFKVEELMFQLVCDPSGAVVDTTLKQLVPAVVKWGNQLEHVLMVLLSHVLSSVQHCPPLSGVEGSVESYLHVLGERERWNVDVLLRLLAGLLPSVHEKAIETCPFPSIPETSATKFSTPLLELYAGGHVQWPAFEWMHVNCLPNLIQFSCLLPPKEDNLRNRTAKIGMVQILLAISELFGDPYSTHVMLPVFLLAVGDDGDLTFFPSAVQSKIRGLTPRTAVAKRLATMCVLPLLLAGVLGAPNKRENLAAYLKSLLVQGAAKEPQSTKCSAEIVDAVRFLCTFEEHHTIIFDILWEMVVSSNVNMKISAASLLKVIVPYVDAKVASTRILPALVTLGSDPNLNVKYASIDAFGPVAQHFKIDVIVDKICVQMDAFLEDGSHEATIAVVRALLIAVPHTTDRLRDYILNILHDIFQFTATPITASNLMRQRERANAFCEAIRALDATDLSAASVRDFLLPAIQNLLKDSEALDPAHKEALEIIMKERSGGTFETISKVMGAHIGIASSMTSFFGEGGLLGKKESAEQPSGTDESPKPVPPLPAEDTRFRRIMRGNFTDMLRGKVKDPEETQNQ
ncbi:hypothetical protein L484_027080 [Morus notabilis]|uniref:LisH domain-containing protein n=1 Tax=Morus notabilis TaxID=981085 RepID=W9S8Y1_9ROSA|nr:hypothetical protein L484_027080 [Morus notabilis]